MISYYKFGKGKLPACEDSLTASVFDPLKYLPPDLLWYILKESALKDNLPVFCGPIQEIRFWEKWNSEGTSNSNFVEPDVFIRFLEFDIIIEAKRYDENQQYEDQLTREVIAYYNEYGEDGKELYLIELGGVDIKNEKDVIKPNNDNCAAIKTTKITWTGILNVLLEVKSKIENQNFPGQENQVLILGDVIEALGIHGFFRKLWLSEMDYTKLNFNLNKFKFVNYERRAN